MKTLKAAFIGTITILVLIICLAPLLIAKQTQSLIFNGVNQLNHADTGISAEIMTYHKGYLSSDLSLKLKDADQKISRVNIHLQHAPIIKTGFHIVDAEINGENKLDLRYQLSLLMDSHLIGSYPSISFYLESNKAKMRLSSGIINLSINSLHKNENLSLKLMQESQLTHKNIKATFSAGRIMVVHKENSLNAQANFKMITTAIKSNKSSAINTAFKFEDNELTIKTIKDTLTKSFSVRIIPGKLLLAVPNNQIPEQLSIIDHCSITKMSIAQSTQQLCDASIVAELRQQPVIEGKVTMQQYRFKINKAWLSRAKLYFPLFYASKIQKLNWQLKKQSVLIHN